MTDFETRPVGTADLVMRLRNAAGIDQMEYPYPMCDEAADRIEQLEAALTRAHAATALVVEQLTADVTFAETDAAFSSITIGKTSAPFNDQPLYIAQLVKHVISSRKRLATPDQTAALDKLIAEAVGPLMDALDAVLAWHDKDKHTSGKMTFERSSVFAKARAASKKGGV